MNTLMNITLRAFALLALACFALSEVAQAQCPQFCDSSNTALGDSAFQMNTLGAGNTAIGAFALESNTTGLGNTAIGVGALLNNTDGGGNIAIGEALGSNTTGGGNITIGNDAMLRNTIGHDNTAIGPFAMTFNISGNFNTAIGENALDNNNNGSRNVALGYRAGTNITSGSRNIDIGSDGGVGDSNTIRIGRVVDQTATFIAGISGATVATGVPVIVDSTGHLGTTTSSARFKEAVKPMDTASEAILALKPVTFRYKHDLDPEGIPQFGLVAEDVEKVNPALVARDDKGKVYTVRYEAVNAMLLNEFLKEHRKNEEQRATIARLEKQVEALTAGLQKVSAQIELSKSAPQTVLTKE